MKSALFEISVASEHLDLFYTSNFPWEWLAKLKDYLEGVCKNQDMPPNCVDGTARLKGDIFVHETARIHPHAAIDGPAWIGPNVIVGHGAYIRGGCILMEGSVVGHATEVKRSIFFPGAHAPHFNYVGDSVLGRNVNLGSGVKCANLRLDRKPVKVRWKKERLDTGSRKIGAIIGDGTQIGCNTVLQPGTILGKRCVVFPNLTVGGTYEDDLRIKPPYAALVTEEIDLLGTLFRGD